MATSPFSTPVTSQYQPPSPCASYSRGVHTVAWFAALFTWPLLFVGGLVTTYRVGMAVPDWPTTFGINMFIYNFMDAAWGVFIEHGHRLYGAAVGFFTIVLTVWLCVFERRVWMKYLGVFALAAVIGQGVLGGVRVLRNSTYLAFVHGCTAQLFFLLTVSLVVFTGRRWVQPQVATETSGPSARSGSDPLALRWWTTALCGLVYAQIVAGAWLRHMGTELWLHVTLSVLVGVGVIAIIAVVLKRRRDYPDLVRYVLPLIGTTALQIALGVTAWWMLAPFDGIPREVTNAQALIRTGHLANGALVLASVFALCLWSWRSAAVSASKSESAARPGSSGDSSVREQDRLLELVS